MIQINQNQKKKIPDTSGLVKKTNYDAKIADIEGKFLMLVIQQQKLH